MRKIIANIGLNGFFVMEIPEDDYRRGQFFIPLPKSLTTNWAENMEASSETTTKKMVFRRYGDDTFNLIGWE
jgi:hypothetical protein